MQRGKAITGCGRHLAASVLNRAKPGREFRSWLLRPSALTTNLTFQAGLLQKWQNVTNVLIVGANQGIGYYLVERLMQCHIIAFLFPLPSTGGSFLGGSGSGIACPGFSVLRFRREFLSRMWTLEGNRAWMHGLARFGMDADRGRP